MVAWADFAAAAPELAARGRERIEAHELILLGTIKSDGSPRISPVEPDFVDGELMRSCILLAVQADGHEVTTIEGLGTAQQMHPVQTAFAEHHGLQCGYCTPGMIMAAVYLLRQSQQPTEPEIREAIAGNLCRCTGYMQIIAAIKAAAEAMHPRQALD